MVTIVSRASAIARRTSRANVASSAMKGSAGSTAITASGPARRCAATAPSPTAAAVLRGIGSATMLAAGRSGIAARTAAA